MADKAETKSNDALPTEHAELVSMLESRLRVVEVCQALRALVDPSDDHYVVQIELASCGAIPALFDLLPSENGSEMIEICETISILCANIEGVSVRKRSGLETGFQETSFNPVQDELSEVEGIRKLVNLLDSQSEGVKEVAGQCLWICCSFNHLNKVSCLRCLIHDLLDHKNERLEHINAFLPDIEVREDVKVLLDQLMLPTLKLVKDEQNPHRKEAVILLGLLVERHPASSTFLCEEGALEPVAQIVLQGGILRSKAVHAFWHLIRQNKDMLHPGRGKLDCEGTSLIEPLVSVIGWNTKTNPDPEPEAEQEEEDQDEDYSDEALLILKALAEQDEDVREKVGDLVDSETSRCSVM